MHGRILSVMFLLFSLLAAAVSPVSGQTSGPLLVVTPSPVDFDTVSCGSSRCIDVVFRNAGDTALTVQQFEPLTAPFQGSIQTPFVLQPGETRSAPWCYTPTRFIASDSVSARFVSDNRTPYSFGLLFDGSDAMSTAIPGAASAIEAAHDVMSTFVATMMADGSPQHEAAVFAYSTSSQFRLLRGLSDDRNLVLGSIPGNASGAHSCVLAGMDRSIGLVQTALHRRVLIVINASEDAGLGNCGPYSAPGVVSAAQAANMLVYTISINGAAGTALASIASQTGGLHHDVTTAVQLDQAMREIMQHLQRAVAQQLIVKGEVVSPSLAFTPPALLFPTTLAGDTLRSTIWVHNVGTSPMEIVRVDGKTTAFDISLIKSVVMPGDSLPATVLYHPTGQTYNTASITMPINGCVPALSSLQLRGMSYLPVNPSIGPVLSVKNDHIDFGRIPCTEWTELNIPLKNVGDAVLKVFTPIIITQSIHPPQEPEWNVGAGSEISMVLSKDATARLGPDSGQVSVSALSRRSASTMIVIDAGSAMRFPWQGTDGAGVSSLVIGDLLGGLAATPELDDQMGVIAAAKDGAQLLQSMTKDKKTLAALSPAAGNSDSTALLQTIGAALDVLENSDGIRRLIILTAGSTESSIGTGNPMIDDLARRVAETGTHVSALSFEQSTISDSLIAFLAACHTTTLLPPTPEAVPALIADIETLSIDTVHQTWTLLWFGISPDIEATPMDVIIPESHPGAPACASVIIRNTGEVPLEIWSVSSETHGFTSTPTTPPIIPVGGSTTLQFCYQPDSLGVWSLDATIRSNSCIHRDITLHMRGEATDSNTISIAGEFVVRPGSPVAIPLLLDHALPAAYDVRRLTFSIGYDPSLLYPDMDAPLRQANGSAFSGTVTATQSFDRTSGLAVTSYDVGANPLAAAGQSAIPFLSLRLNSYLGRMMKTDVRLLSSAFPGSAVALGHSSTASVRIDSMCWLEQRLVNASALWGTLGKNAPNPSPGQTRITYTLTGDVTVRLALYDLHGRLLRIIEEAPRSAGSYTSVIDTRGMSAGAYICRLESEAGILSRVILVSNGEEK
ncbi:MAG: choice-of-anchor D domain-containing protein [Bacteroidota bacterium]